MLTFNKTNSMLFNFREGLRSGQLVCMCVSAQAHVCACTHVCVCVEAKDNLEYCGFFLFFVFFWSLSTLFLSQSLLLGSGGLAGSGE